MEMTKRKSFCLRCLWRNSIDLNLRVWDETMFYCHSSHYVIMLLEFIIFPWNIYPSSHSVCRNCTFDCNIDIFVWVFYPYETNMLIWRGSMKSLRRERETLSKLMQKRFAEEERKRLFQRWGIALTSKRRRAQLVGQLWSKTNDMNHVIESAAIVAKLIRFVEQGRALKEMFGLSFTPPRSTRRSYSWKNSRASFV